MVQDDVVRGGEIPVETWEFAIDGGTVLARPGLPCLFCLNPTAGLIWNAYREAASPEDAASALVKRFARPRESAEEDVTSTLSSWADAGLLGPFNNISAPKWDGQHAAEIAAWYCTIEGTKFLVQTDSPEFAAEVAPRLGGLRIGTCTPDVTIGVWRTAHDGMAIVAGEEVVSIEPGVPAARVVLFQELVRRARPERQWLALLHAAACGIGGRCVLTPAASGSGKSTLAAALMASGFTVYSDDFVGIEAGSFRIPAMPFPIAIRRGSWSVLRDWTTDLDERLWPETPTGHASFLPLIANGAAAPGSAAAIVFTRWVEGSGVSLQKLSTADAIGRLDRSGFWVAHDQDSIGAFLGWLDGLPKFDLTYGDLTDAVAHVAALARPM